MSGTFKYDVFLSYSSKERETVRALAEHLKKDGLHMWMDTGAIKLVGSILPKIQQGLGQSRTSVLCQLPVAWRSDWVALEGSRMLFRGPSNAGHRFITLLMANRMLSANENCPKRISRCLKRDRIHQLLM